MPRPRKRKLIHSQPIPQNRAIFKPVGIPMNQLLVNMLTMVEFEAIRLIDWKGMSQSEAAELMDISQPTISRILNTGRAKIADFLVNGKALRIDGGDFKFAFHGYGCMACSKEWEHEKAQAPEKCPSCESEKIYVLDREQ